MAQNDAATPADYIDALPPERATVIRKLRAAMRKAMPRGFTESMTWGMPTYEVPLSRYPKTYNGKPLMYAAIAAQKNHYAVYLSAPYQDPALLKRLEDGFAEAGAKLDMGKSCVRFRTLDDLPLEVIQEIVGALSVDAFIDQYERARAEAPKRGSDAGRRGSRKG